MGSCIVIPVDPLPTKSIDKQTQTDLVSCGNVEKRQESRIPTAYAYDVVTSKTGQRHEIPANESCAWLKYCAYHDWLPPEGYEEIPRHSRYVF